MKKTMKIAGFKAMPKATASKPKGFKTMPKMEKMKTGGKVKC